MNGHQKQKEDSVRMIEEALFVLMKEKKYAQITVTELVKKADVSRRTFYRLYSRKDDVLGCYFKKLCQEYCQKSSVLQRYDIHQIAREYFCFWYQYRDILLLLHKSSADEMLYQEISRVSANVVKSRIGENEMKNADGIEYFADYSAGGFLMLLKRWIAAGMKEEAGRYAESISKALLKFIKPASV